ncbi:MAG: amidohydrolase family protein, partial [Cyclobacteriaceae bacterium]|nr:amidohydrolase family protein [Cyclobacteriaceae bacterium]
EQVFVDGFTRAKTYGAAWNKYNDLSNRARASELPPRRDLALEALWEILQGERYITCHSYVQSEINMLMKIAEQFDFRVQTFTHILEGYKVADKMQAHGVGGSTFSDWWGYKYEVIEAIPYNASLMTGEGVVTAINSDNAEMGRRLNQEAAKSIKYGGMSEEDAWKMVTLNPAKLLQLDHRMGSIKVGKDADLVLWTHNPLSVYATVEQTMIDGAVYFDRIKDEQHQRIVASERNRLIQNILQSGEKPGGSTAKQPPPQLHCEDLIYEN